MVQEYESDDLSLNSEDEKKIKKAKSAAEKREKMLGLLAAWDILSRQAKLVVIISTFAVRPFQSVYVRLAHRLRYFVNFSRLFDCLSNQPLNAVLSLQELVLV